MSYDLGVFKTASPLSVDEVAALYESICSRRGTSVATPGLLADRSVDAFYRELIARYPELDDDEESPFACAIDHEDRWVVMSLSLSRADEVAAFVEQAALAAGLDTYDPQLSRLLSAHDKAAKPRTAQAPALPQREGIKRLVERIAPAFRSMGFEAKARGAGRTWARTTPSGVVHRIGLNLGCPEARLEIEFSTTSAAALVNQVLPECKGNLPGDLLSTYWFRGYIPDRPWTTPKEDAKFDFAICHQECVAKSALSMPSVVRDYALPLFDRMSTPEALDAMFDRTEPFEMARPNWTGPFAERSGILTLLHRVALARLVRDSVGANHVAANAKATIQKWKASKAEIQDARTRLDALLALDLQSKSSSAQVLSRAAPKQKAAKKKP